MSGDGAAAVTVARSLGLDGRLQQVGDHVLLDLDYAPCGAAEFAEQCSGALRVRGRDGDQELASAIDAARGAPSRVTRLTQLAVDLEQLADRIGAGPNRAGGRLELTAGKVRPEFAFQDSIDEDFEDDDPDRWRRVRPVGFRRACNDMVDFTATRRISGFQQRLDRALDGRGAFRQFKESLNDCPEDREDWFLFARTATEAEPANGLQTRATAPHCETTGQPA